MMSKTAVVSLTVMILALVSGAVIIILTGNSVNDLAIIYPQIIALITMGFRLERIGDRTKSIEKKVNGHLTELTAKIPDADPPTRPPDKLDTSQN